MIPQFNERGDLPPGFHGSTVDEFETRFVENVPESKTRQPIFAGYLRYCKDLFNFDVPLEQWLDGSFITNKIDPDDIDIMSLVDASKLTENNEKHVKSLFIYHDHSNRGYLNSKYNCDPFVIAVYPPSHKYYHLTLKSIDYWYGAFGHVGGNPEKPSKGLIRIDLNDDRFKTKGVGI